MPYVYPPQLAFALTPLTALPEDVAVVHRRAASLAALMGALALVGVRDVRCYAVVVIWAPGWNALEMANVSAALVLVLAVRLALPGDDLAARRRARLLVSPKLFLWPCSSGRLRRRRSALAGAAGRCWAVLTLGSWAVIGFAGLSSYPELLSGSPSEESYSIAGCRRPRWASVDRGRIGARRRRALLAGRALRSRRARRRAVVLRPRSERRSR